MHQERSLLARDALLLAIAALVCRAIVLAILPDAVFSNDVGHWVNVARELQQGHNPYATTTYLNWPPVWMQIIFVLQRVAHAVGAPITDVIRWFLVAVDSINIALAFLIAAQFSSRRTASLTILLGLVLNPVAVFLVCQHGNFDALVVTALLAFTIALIRYHRTNDSVDWLSAAFWLGVGVLIKTIPLLLAPLLIWRAHLLPVRARVLGLMLLVTPVAVGLSVIYVLSPDQVTANVLRYRSYGGWFGITGLLDLAGLTRASAIYAAIFPIIAIAALVVVARFLRRFSGSPEYVILLVATLLSALIAFGPGYGAQYIAWPLPFYVISFACFDSKWRNDLKAAWIVSIIIYTIEYALIADHGHFLIGPNSSAQLRHMSDVLYESGVRTLLRLPLFALYLWLIAAAVARLRAVQLQETAG